MGQGADMHRRALGVFALGLVLLMGFSASVGAVEISALHIAALCLEPFGVDIGADPTMIERSVLWSIRLPRIMLGVVVGSTLAIAGATLQGIFRNPLADPGLIGVSSGAALAVVGLIVFGGGLGVALEVLTPGVAFIGALGATLIVLMLSQRDGHIDVATMLLAGVAVNAFAGALIGFATYMATEAQLRSLTMWSLGSMAGATWSQVGLVSACALPCVLWLLYERETLDLLLLGEREAGHLGVDVSRVRRRMVIACALMVGSGVGFTGMIGFVGLVVPHLLRLGGGAHHRWLLPGSMWVGAALLTAADLIARTIAAPAELPIGVVTAIVGAPFFLWLLVRGGGWR